MALTLKQARFVEEYLIDLNATQAAIRAGYSPKMAYSIGEENTKKPEVKAAIDKVLAERSKRTGVSADRVILEYAKIAFSDMRNFAEWGPSGITLKSCDDLSPDDSACIAELSETETKDGGSIRFKLHDKKGALDSLAKHLGMFTDKLELTGKDGGPVEIESVREKIASKLSSIAARIGSQANPEKPDEQGTPDT